MPDISASDDGLEQGGVAARVETYDAFISYSHAADGRLAPAIQRGLHRFAKPWYRLRALRVFRDETSLSATPELWPSIVTALDGARWFILLASPEAAKSQWVNDEVDQWCNTKSAERIMIVVTKDDQEGDFDWERTAALPPALRKQIEEEPRIVDLRWASAVVDVSLHNARFRDAIADIAAPLHGRPKDELNGEDVRQHRRTRLLARTAVATLTILLAVAVVAAFVAVDQRETALQQRDRAERQARLALSRQLAAQSVTSLDVDPEQSLVLAARAATTAGTDEARDALRRALRGSRLRSIIDARAPVHDVEIDPGGHLVAAALEDGSLRTWNIQTGQTETTRRFGGASLESVSFSRDGGRLLGAGDQGAAVWSTAPNTRRPLATFDGKGKPLAAALSPDGQLAATGDFDGLVRLWRADTGTLVDRLSPPGARAPITAVSFSADGTRLVASAGSRTVVWTLSTNSPRVLGSGGREVEAVTFSPDGVHVADGNVAGVARVWNLATGGSLELHGHEGAVTSLAFSRDGKLLVTASEDGTGRIWDVSTGRSVAELRGQSGLLLGATFAPDGETVVTGGQDGTIRAWAVAPDPIRAELVAPNDLTLRDVGFSPSGELLVTAGEDGTARVWDVGSGRVLHVLRHGHGADDWVESAQFSRDGRRILTAGDDGTANLWDASTEKLLATLGGSGAPPLFDAALSPDGQTVAAAGLGPFVHIWQWRKHEERRLNSSLERVDGVAFSPVGGLVAGAGGKTVNVWRANDGTAVARLVTPERRDRLTSVDFDPNGTFVAAGSSSGAAWIWDLQKKTAVAHITGLGDTVTDVAYSADGRYLVVTAGHAGIANVWAVPSGRFVTTVRTPSASLEGADFAPRGRSVAVAGAGGRATVFDCAECRPLRPLVCLAASRLTPEVRVRERRAFGRCA